MANFILFLCILLMAVVPVELACWAESSYGNVCYHNGHLLASGDVYENTRGPKCYKCTCGDGGFLRCCDTGTIIRDVPSGCAVKRVGCNDQVFNATDESKPCNAEISAVLG